MAGNPTGKGSMATCQNTKHRGKYYKLLVNRMQGDQKYLSSVG